LGTPRLAALPSVALSLQKRRHALEIQGLPKGCSHCLSSSGSRYAIIVTVFINTSHLDPYSPWGLIHGSCPHCLPTAARGHLGTTKLGHLLLLRICGGSHLKREKPKSCGPQGHEPCASHLSSLTSFHFPPPSPPDTRPPSCSSNEPGMAALGLLLRLCTLPLDNCCTPSTFTKVSPRLPSSERPPLSQVTLANFYMFTLLGTRAMHMLDSWWHPDVVCGYFLSLSPTGMSAPQRHGHFLVLSHQA
jgi:hypothetical protein